jgi:HD-GYP domain-containing protein (c-di-GMP phosphodiesterase class II)
LQQEEIRIEARIIRVADVFEAMTFHRPYRPALGQAVAIKELKKNKNKLYDPLVVDCLLKFLRN